MEFLFIWGCLAAYAVAGTLLFTAVAGDTSLASGAEVIAILGWPIWVPFWAGWYVGKKIYRSHQ